MKPIRAVTLAAFVAAVTLLMPPTAGAAGGQYTVLKCHIYSRSASEVEAAAAGPYQTADSCAAPDQRLEVTVNGFGLPGQAGYVRFTAPDNTAIVGVTADANLRRDNHHFAQLAVVDHQGTSRVLAQGSDSGDGFQTYSFSNLNDLRFVVQLFCSDPGGCPNSAQAHAYVRNIGLVLEDRSDPGVTEIGGSLLESAWLRGEKVLQASAVDLGSGLAALSAMVNGTAVGNALGQCTGILGLASSVLVPCVLMPGGAQLTTTINTAAPPFQQGANRLEICPRDFAGNSPPCSSAVISVDNQPPTLAFANTPDPADPELIRVAVIDDASGVDPSSVQISYRPVGGAQWTSLPTRLGDGSALARVDSGSVPPGEYEFVAAARDTAGNTAQTGARADGEPAVLRFPLREPVQLVARLGSGDGRGETVRYGRGSVARGRLLDTNGEPMPSQPVTVSEYFGAGALIDRRVRTVTTDKRGRWASELPAGPSRRVEVSFEGTQRYRPQSAAPADLTVRGRASFDVSRDRIHEGSTVGFAGKVGHFGARVPNGGKLIELQVRDGRRRWNTVREAFRTDSSGHFRTTYRFGRFYETNATFVFRVKVAREQGWPYQAPGRSRSRQVIVVANR